MGRDKEELTPKKLEASVDVVALERVIGDGRVVEGHLNVQVAPNGRIKCVSGHGTVSNVRGQVRILQHLVVLELKAGN